MAHIPGGGWKKVHVYVNDASHADLRIRLRYYNISQSEFLRTVIEAMIEQNPNMVKLIMEKLESRNSKRKKKNILKDQKDREHITKEFGLDKDELEDIFDLLEKENPDI
jgi:hypothetical protein